jgi:hypothetical protein
MKKIFIVIIAGLTATGGAHAQVGADSIIKQPETKLDVINKARNMLFESFEANNKIKVKELQHYLNDNYENSNYIALYPDENMLLYYWTENYLPILSFVEQIDTLNKQWKEKAHPTSILNLYSLLRTKIINENIQDSISHLPLPAEQKDFLQSYLKYYFVDQNNLDSTLQDLNTTLKKFKKNYPESSYNKYLTFYEAVPSNWEFGLGIDIGSHFFSGQLSSTFNAGFIMQLYFEASYKKVVGLFDIRLYGNDLTRDVVDDKNPSIVWNKGERAFGAGISLMFGHNLLEKGRFIITPLAGIGFNTFSPTEKTKKAKPELDDLNYSFTAISFGFNVDLRLGAMKRILGHEILNPNFYALRLNYRFYYQGLSNMPSILNGNMHTITLGILLHNARVKYEKR